MGKKICKKKKKRKQKPVFITSADFNLFRLFLLRLIPEKVISEDRRTDGQTGTNYCRHMCAQQRNNATTRTFGTKIDSNQWFEQSERPRTGKDWDVSTGALARLFAHSLVLLTHSLTPHCALHSRAPLRSLIHLLAHSLTLELMGK